MKLIFIYGPPAAGKFTVGSIVAEKTGFKFFHNHLTVVVGEALFGRTSPERSELVQALRVKCLAAAAKYGVNTVFTFAYSGAVDDIFVSKIVKSVEKYAGQVCFVQLFAPEPELMNRIANDSRKQLGKMSDQESLSHTLAARSMYDSVKYPHLTISTVQYSADDAADQVIRHYKLSN